jgi:hypothetical protein
LHERQVEDDCCISEYVPMAQAWHVVLALVLAKRPAEQFVHKVEEASDEKRPSGHAVHVELSAAPTDNEKKPARQLVHDVLAYNLEE